MISDVPVGAFLSGGLDSSLILALMKKNTQQEISTFTIKFSDEDQRFERMPRDAEYASIVAKFFNSRHYEFEIQYDIVNLLPKIIWHLDEPLADSASINTYLISKSARENNILVLLNGMGGDEIFGGYRSQLACILSELYRALVPDFAHYLFKSVIDRFPTATANRGIRTVRWVKRFLSISSLPQIERYLLSDMITPQEFSLLFSQSIVDNGDYWNSHFVKSQLHTLERNDISYITKMCLNDTQVFLPELNLSYCDKCTMAAGVESRPPLTDHEIVDFMFSLHPKFRIKRVTQKYLLKKVAESYLPKEIVYRPKAPFGAPLRSWIRGPLSEMIADYLSPASLKRRGIYNAQFVWDKIQKDRNGMEDNAHLIWSLLCNEIWIRTFFG
jgi:asparagine synthase (glutamine-hydrolysing)